MHAVNNCQNAYYISLARVDACIATVLQNLTLPGDMQWLRANALWWSLFQECLNRQESAGPNRSPPRQVLGASATGISPCSSGLREKNGLLTMNRKETIVLQASSTRKVFLAVRNDWWSLYIGTGLESGTFCFIAGTNSDFTEVIFLNPVIPQNALDDWPLPVKHWKIMNLVVQTTTFSFSIGFDKIWLFCQSIKLQLSWSLPKRNT